LHLEAKFASKLILPSSPEELWKKDPLYHLLLRTLDITPSLLFKLAPFRGLSSTFTISDKAIFAEPFQSSSQILFAP
jgi:hypothetical protein